MVVTLALSDRRGGLQVRCVHLCDSGNHQQITSDCEI